MIEPRAGVISVTLLTAGLLISFPARSQDAAPEELHRGADYPGAQYFFTLPTVTVVYPGGESEQAARNLRSALARAAYLREQFGMSTQVVADVEVTDSQRGDHLLILGWGNRLFDDETAARPFSRTGEAVRFLGIEHLDPDADLLFFARSPFAPDRFVLFWSRIDPEKDRFSVLPRLGSDWAIYEEFLPLRQGMFLPGEKWPPTRDTRAEADHEPEILGERTRRHSRKAGRYQVFWNPDEFSAEEIDRIVSARQRALGAAVAALGAPPDAFRIALYVYPDNAAKKERTGVPDPTHSSPWSAELHMIRSVAVSPSPHEDSHLLARALYGPSVVSAVYEGFAISVEERTRGLPLEVASALLLDSGAFPTLATLLDEESFRRLPEAVSAPAAGMLGSWIRTVSSGTGLAAAYGALRGEPAALAAALGREPERIEGEFREWVATRAKAREKDVHFHRAEVEAQEAYLAGDWSGMIAALRKALSHRPNDPQTLFNLASAEMRAARYDAAEESLRRLLALPLPAVESRFRIFGHYQLGRVHDLQGRREEALDEYRKVLQLPDESGAHRLAEERILTPASREELE